MAGRGKLYQGPGTRWDGMLELCLGQLSRSTVKVNCRCKLCLIQSLVPCSWTRLQSLDKMDWLSARSTARVDNPKTLGVSTYTSLGKEVETRYPPSGRLPSLLSRLIHSARPSDCLQHDSQCR